MTNSKDVTERTSEIVESPIESAQQMTEWFSDYVFGFSDEIRDLPPETIDRLQSHFSPGTEFSKSLKVVSSLLLKETDEGMQQALALYVCGYPSDAIAALSDFSINDIQAYIYNHVQIDGSKSKTLKKVSSRIVSITIDGQSQMSTLIDLDQPAPAGKDSMGMYVDDLHTKGKNLLSAEQEVDIAKRIESGLIADKVIQARAAGNLQEFLLALEVRDIETSKNSKQEAASVDIAEKAVAISKMVGQLALDKTLSDDELEWLASDGDSAKNEFLEKNLRLAVNIARRYHHSGTTSMQMIDMISEGNFGLIRAVEKFDFTKGYKFSTYATWWVRQAITRALADQSRTIRIPVHMNDVIVSYQREKRQFLAMNNREPTDTELCEALKIKPGELANVRNAILTAPVSTNTLVGSDGDAEFGDLIGEQEAGFGEVEQAQALVALKRELMTLSDRERFVIEHRFGMVNGEPHTLDEIGVKLGVSRERVRQIESKTMSKLRHPSRSGRLGNILNNFH